MPNYSKMEVAQNQVANRTSGGQAYLSLALVTFSVALVVVGCQTKNDQPSKSEMSTFSNLPTTSTSAPADMSTAVPTNTDLLILHEGDVLSVTFPGAAELNTIATIRRDGRITLKNLGEFKAAGLTPPEMEKAIIEQFGAQLQTKEVSVAVQSSAFPVYVTGAVLRPGKVLSDRPIKALEAIMEAGGFDYTKANLKAVRVLRNQNGQTMHYTLNLKEVLKGSQSDQFNLKPGDILYVPERFTMF